MWSRKRIAIVVGIIVIAIVVGLAIYWMTFAFEDYWPPRGILKAEKIADNAVTFTIIDGVWGADGPVKFDNCALDLKINNQSLRPTDYVMSPGPYGWPLRTTHGSGFLNASVFSDGPVSYVIVLNDVDTDGYVSWGDTISLTATEPLMPSTACSIFFLTELRSSWGPGSFEGNYTA
ncbi:MAG: hypothetical protein LUQ14_01995 [Methanomassiliicoccales archaeon]|nr:hypothetical protein [Methanomassiliicoccales archaeon]